MNEIMFRAWDLNNKKMYDSYIVDEDGNFCVNGDFTNNCECSNEDKVIQLQFTGLKDKNGKRIYIGDILNWDNDCIIEIKPKDELGFYYEELGSYDKNCCSWDIRFYRSDESCEVIGNIYENEKIAKKKFWTNKKLKEFALEEKREEMRCGICEFKMIMDYDKELNCYRCPNCGFEDFAEEVKK